MNNLFLPVILYIRDISIQHHDLGVSYTPTIVATSMFFEKLISLLGKDIQSQNLQDIIAVASEQPSISHNEPLHFFYFLSDGIGLIAKNRIFTHATVHLEANHIFPSAYIGDLPCLIAPADSSVLISLKLNANPIERVQNTIVHHFYNFDSYYLDFMFISENLIAVSVGTNLDLED